ncbi:hypothetical protein RRF57_008581 [Xylaria bambusicola]|uniref:Uncharacterized protein n=1 Tax=Xylaria bambusicola TaxID=326684 RepID=A0AAN7Z758_9PEZI
MFFTFLKSESKRLLDEDEAEDPLPSSSSSVDDSVESSFVCIRNFLRRVSSLLSSSFSDSSSVLSSLMLLSNPSSEIASRHSITFLISSFFDRAA